MFERMRAVFLQEFFMTKRTLESLTDLFWFPLMSTIVLGFVAQYLASGSGAIYGRQIMIGYVLWEVFRLTQFSISVAPLWNMWSHTLSNLFITPISIGEYILAQFISSTLKSFITFLLNGLVLYFLFGFNISSIGLLNILVFLINIWVFGWAMGAVILGIIWKVGSRIAAISWGLIYILQPLTASIFPVDVLPKPLQMVAHLFPVTYIFEMARNLVAEGVMDWKIVAFASVLNGIYFVAAIMSFQYLFNKSKETGQFAKNDLQ